MSQPNPQPAVKTDQTFWIYLSYIFGWILGLVSLAVVKDDERTRFQSAQAIVLSGAATIAVIALRIVGLAFFFFAPLNYFFQSIAGLVGLAYFVFAIILIIQNAQNQNPRVPVAGDFAEKNVQNLFK